MIKLVAVIRRVEGMDRTEFLRRWQEVLPPMVLRLPGLRGYVQSPAIEFHRAWPWDGAAELWFDDLESARRALRGPEGLALRDYEATFIGEINTIMTTETTVLKP